MPKLMSSAVSLKAGWTKMTLVSYAVSNYTSKFDYKSTCESHYYTASKIHICIPTHITSTIVRSFQIYGGCRDACCLRTTIVSMLRAHQDKRRVLICKFLPSDTDEPGLLKVFCFHKGANKINMMSFNRFRTRRIY